MEDLGGKEIRHSRRKEVDMRSKIIVTLIALLVGLIAAALGQQGKTAKVDTKTPITFPSDYKYNPTEVQQLKLQLKQRDAQLAQVALREAQSNFQQKVKDLMEEGVAIRNEQGWPESVQLNPDALSFSQVEVAKTDKKE